MLGLVPRQLPAAVGDFTGRVSDLAALDALLARDPGDTSQTGTVVISAIDGAAGIGKTTLAVYWAHRMRHRFPDGTLYTNLRGYGPGHPAAPAQVLEAFLRALGTPRSRIPKETDERSALYRSLLDGRRILIVLDNANTSDQVRPLLPGSPGCLALVTSRSSMTGLVISQGAARISLDLLPFDEAVILLRGIIGNSRADAEPAALAGIVCACARLPLALRVAGARAASRPHLRLARLRDELRSQQDRIGALSATGDETTAVRPVFDWSYLALPPRQALAFRRLGLHPGVAIDVYAAAALADTTPDTAREFLEALADVHLVESVAADRYVAHDLLRAYALERAEREETLHERADALTRLLGFYLHTADAADRKVMMRWRLPPDAAPPPPHMPAFDSRQQAMEWFETEYTNLTAAAHHAAEAGLHPFAWQLPAALNGLFDHGGRRSDWVTATENGLASARTLGDRRGEIYMLLMLSDALCRVRQPENAVGLAELALGIARKQGDLAWVGYALNAAGFVYMIVRRFDDATSCYMQAGEICRARDDSWSEAHALNGLGRIHQELGRFKEAMGCHQRALDAFRQAHDQTRESYTLCWIGDTHRASGRLETALNCHGKAFELARHVGARMIQAMALCELGTDLEHTGDLPGAGEHWHHALTLFEQLGDPQADDIRARLESLPD